MSGISPGPSIEGYVRSSTLTLYLLDHDSRRESTNLEQDHHGAIGIMTLMDITVTKEDVDCIRNGWLTDNVRDPEAQALRQHGLLICNKPQAIQFWQEYVSSSPCYPCGDYVAYLPQVPRA